MRVAAGAVAKKWLIGALRRAHPGVPECQLGPLVASAARLGAGRAEPILLRGRGNLVPQLEAYMQALIKQGDSVGARINVVAEGMCPAGWGEPVFDRLDADIAHAMMSINAVKGVEVGDGFASVAQLGSEHRDLMSSEGFPE